MVARHPGRHKAGPYEITDWPGPVGATLVVARQPGRHKTGPYKPGVPGSTMYRNLTAQANSFSTTFPWTSVSRKSRPWKR